MTGASLDAALPAGEIPKGTTLRWQFDAPPNTVVTNLTLQRSVVSWGQDSIARSYFLYYDDADFAKVIDHCSTLAGENCRTLPGRLERAGLN